MKKANIFFLVLIISSGINIIYAQQNNVYCNKYTLIIPDDYQYKEKTYPLVVCYSNELTDTLFQRYAINTQTIILQFNNTSDTTLVSDTLRAFIQKTIHEFSIASDKIYLLGINQNIRKTSQMREELKYYFAATAYITNNRYDYTILYDSLKQYNTVKLYLIDAIDDYAMGTAHQLFLQHKSWAFDNDKISQDAVRLKTVVTKEEKYNWQVSLSYGQWYFDHSAKARVRPLLEFRNNMGAWNLSCARFLSEKVSVNANLGVLLKKIEPPGPNIFSILGGDTIDVKGGGIFFMPLSIGMDYFFSKKRFRPYAGFGLGMVQARYKDVAGSGNLSNGIIRKESSSKSNASLVELSSGFVYRTGNNTNWGLNGDLIRSMEFSENISGFKSFNGFKVSVVFTVLF